MAAALNLLKCVASSLMKHLFKFGGNAAGFGVGGDMLVDAWESWSKQRDEQQRHSDIEALAQANAQEIRRMVEVVVAEVGRGQPTSVCQLVETYLSLIPGTIRQSHRRPSDPTGKTMSATLSLRTAEDLLVLLPSKLPRFKLGDRPLPGVDWVLVELLGIGGFGEVWKAENPHFDSVPPVALKFCTDSQAKDRLLKHEAGILNRVMSQVRHPGIVPLQQTYLGADPPCLAYEFVPGSELTGLIQDSRTRGGMSPPQAARIILNLAEIVGFAHQLQPPIVHRDLKPANILVQPTRERKFALRIADFGIGGLAASQAITRTKMASGRGQRLTTGVRGAYTPLYASPQQIRGEPPDPRDDVHALGVIWYQLLMGDLNTGAPTGLHWPEDLQRRGMGAEQIGVLAACLDSRSENRLSNATILALRLRITLNNVSPPLATLLPDIAGPDVGRAEPLSPSTPSVTRPRLVAGVVLSLVLLVGVIMILTSRKASDSPTRSSNEKGRAEINTTGTLKDLRSSRVKRWRFSDGVHEWAALGVIFAVSEPDGRYLVVRAPKTGPVEGKVADLDKFDYLCWDLAPDKIPSFARDHHLTTVPKRVRLFCTKELEKRMLELELAYANRREANIKETIFRVLGSDGNGNYDLQVESQQPLNP